MPLTCTDCDRPNELLFPWARTNHHGQICILEQFVHSVLLQQIKYVGNQAETIIAYMDAYTTDGFTLHSFKTFFKPRLKCLFILTCFVI